MTLEKLMKNSENSGKLSKFVELRKTQFESSTNQKIVCIAKI